MKICAATPADLSSMIELERSSPAAAHWTEKQYRQILQTDSANPRLVLLAEKDALEPRSQPVPETAGSLSGFLVAQHVAPEWELENIVVSVLQRRKGIASRLLDALLARARESHSTAIFLDVRESNNAARRLYEKAGFQRAGRRKNYYSAPAEDAILYRLTLD